MIRWGPSFVAAARRTNPTAATLARWRCHDHLRPMISRPTDTLRIGVRYTSQQLGEGETGHIKTEPDEGIIFVGNVFPLRLRWFQQLPWQSEESVLNVMNKVNQYATKADPMNILQGSTLPFTPVSVIPRYKDGGAFVKFKYNSGVSQQDVEVALRDYFKQNQVTQWWNPFGKTHAGLVRGKPWLEDLFRLPCKRIKVEFLPTSPNAGGVQLSQEQLYSFFRPYGKLVDIKPQPQDSKVLPFYAHIDYSNLRQAILAKNCLHGLIVSEADGGGVPEVVLRLSYERTARANWIWDWISSHTRIVIPVVAALVAGITVAVFDPIRIWFIKIHVTKQFHITDNRFYRWFKAQATDLFRHKSSEDASMAVIWSDRKDNISALQGWLLESAETFNVVQGPRGSGKKELIDEALKHRKNKLTIDCKPIQDARGDSSTISAAAAEVGYRPVFSFANTMSGWIDLIAQGTTGVKTGLSETLDTQLQKIWNSTAVALKQIALDGRKRDEKDANMSDDEYLEAHPERRPVVIIDNFLHKSNENPNVYDNIAEWAARLTTANIAHVIFLTNDVSFTRSLSKALPDRVFREISLSDASPAAAKQYVISHLDADGESSDDPDHPGGKLTPSQRRRDLVQLDECIDSLGGRLVDLEFLARRVKTGETPKQAVRRIVQQSSSEILKLYLTAQETTPAHPWTAEQAWHVVKTLAGSETGVARYNEIAMSDIFKGNGEKILQALEQAEMISIAASANGRPMTIRPGKPVFLPAFRRLDEDVVLRNKLDMGILKEYIKDEQGSIDKYEKELELLANLPKRPAELAPRMQWLLNKIAASQANVESYEAQVKVLKAVFSKED